MRPASAGAKEYTYSWEPWNITAGEPVDASTPLASWTTTAFNTFATTAAEGGVLYASDQFRGEGIKRFEGGEVTSIPADGLEGDVSDLVCI